VYNIFENGIEITPKAALLAAIGAIVGLVTVSGGFSSMAGGPAFSPPGGIFMKIAVTLVCAGVGYFWGMRQSE